MHLDRFLIEKIKSTARTINPVVIKLGKCIFIVYSGAFNAFSISL